MCCFVDVIEMFPLFCLHIELIIFWCDQLWGKNNNQFVELDECACIIKSFNPGCVNPLKDKLLYYILINLTHEV